MGSIISAARIEALAEVKGAEGDRLIWLDATGPIHEQVIDSPDWGGTFTTDNAKTFLRAELIAASSRQSILDSFKAGLEGRSLPWQLKGADLTHQPIRRALSNPIYLKK
jgi:hypothetical protein